MAPGERAPACTSSPWTLLGWRVQGLSLCLGPALVGTVGYWQSPAPGLTALAMPMGTGGARSSPMSAALHLPSPMGSLSPLGTRQGLPQALPLCLPPSCLPTAPTAQGCEEAAFPFLLPVCSIRGPTHQLGTHQAAPPPLLCSCLRPPAFTQPCPGQQRAQRRQEKPHLPFQSLPGSGAALQVEPP